MILALRWAASSLVWVSSTSSICWPQVITGLSAVIGSWKIIDMRVQRSSRSRVSPAASTFSPSSRISPETGFKRLGQQAHDGEGDHRLARARFAHQADDLAGIDREAHFLDRMDAVGADRQGNAQIADFEDGLFGFGHQYAPLASSRPEREARSGGTFSSRLLRHKMGPFDFAALRSGCDLSRHTFLLIFGSSVSRRPSPMMLIASTVNARKMPG